MFSVRNVPVVIEPGVDALEAEFFVIDKKIGERVIPVHIPRVALSDKTANQLPFIVTALFPHVFSVTADLDKSAVLLVYDMVGRLTYVYTRPERAKHWEKYEVADEHAGKTVTQFSVRFSFSSEKDRDKFMSYVGKFVNSVTNGDKIHDEDVVKAFRLLARSRVSPVVLPVAILKSELKSVKL